MAALASDIDGIAAILHDPSPEFSLHDDSAYLSKHSPTERLAPASKNIFECGPNVSGGWVALSAKATWAISEPAILPVFPTVDLAVTSVSFSLVLGPVTSRSEYRRVV